MLTCSLEELILNLKYTWKISRNASDSKHNFVVCIAKAGNTFKGEVAPNIRYGETPELIKSQFSSLLSDLNKVLSESDLQVLLASRSICNSLRFGIESAFIHFFAFEKGQHPREYLHMDLPKGVFTSYTIPILPPSEIQGFIDKHQLTRFQSIKLKVGEEGMLDMMDAIAHVYPGKIRIDANEAWANPDYLLQSFEKLKKYNIEFIEQPFSADKTTEYQYLKNKSPYPIIGDESITSDPDFETLATCFHGINMKLMKAGGYRNGIKILQDARKFKLKTMIGCMVETSLGIFSAFNLCNEVNYIDLDGCLLFLTFEGYLQYQYKVFGERYGLATLIPALLFMVLAYRFDHKGVLSMGITGMAGWLGISTAPTEIFEIDFETGYTLFISLFYGAVLAGIAFFSKIRNKKAHYFFTYFNFAIHLLFIGTLAGIFISDLYLVYALFLGILSFLVIRYARHEQSNYFFLIASLYSYVGASTVYFKVLIDLEPSGDSIIWFGFFYFIGTCASIIFFILNFKKLLSK
jgi:L-alanine-DL-glutamate epimerase-like enolase superfamily enzyme